MIHMYVCMCVCACVCIYVCMHVCYTFKNNRVASHYKINLFLAKIIFLTKIVVNTKHNDKTLS